MSKSLTSAFLIAKESGSDSSSITNLKLASFLFSILSLMLDPYTSELPDLCDATVTTVSRLSVDFFFLTIKIGLDMKSVKLMWVGSRKFFDVSICLFTLHDGVFIWFVRLFILLEN